MGSAGLEDGRARVDVSHRRRGIMPQAEEAPGERLFFPTPARAIPYLALAHPSYARTFNMPHHLAHVHAGFTNPGVGAPGRQ